jgi:choline transporter-like protein 2/4/5
MCGKTKGVEDKPNLFFFDITRCISLTTAITGCSTKQICVKECPQVNSYKKIPAHKDRIKEFCDPQETTNCPDYLLSSGPVLGRCVPKGISNALNVSVVLIEAFDEEHNKSVPIQVPDINGPSDLTFDTLKKSVKYLKDVLDIKKTFELAYEDLSECVWVILIGLVLGAVIAFAWMFLLRFIIKPMIYVTILVVLALLGFGSYLCIGEYIKMNNVNSKVDKYDLKFDLSDLKYLSSLKETWLVSGIVTGVIFLVLFFVIIFIRKRIRMAAELIKEVSKAIVLIPASLVWPFIPFVIEVRKTLTIKKHY